MGSSKIKRPVKGLMVTHMKKETKKAGKKKN